MARQRATCPPPFLSLFFFSSKQDWRGSKKGALLVCFCRLLFLSGHSMRKRMRAHRNKAKREGGE